METREAVPDPQARIIGVVYLLYFVLAFGAAFLMKGLIIRGDAAATASSILAHESLYRSAFAVALISNILYIAVTALFYRLFAPVSRTISIIAAFFSLVGCAIQLFGSLFQLAPLIILRSPQLSTVFIESQLQALALLSLSTYSQVFNVSLVLFAAYDLLLGYLVVHSTFVPRALGWFLIAAGIGWLTFVWPPFAITVSAFVLPFGALAEIVLMFWLLFMGAKVDSYREKARAVGAAEPS